MSDRKYRQPSYRDGEPPAREPKPRPGPPPDRSERPRGRGLGAPTESIFRCARCGESAPVGGAAAPGARCASCGADLHTCTNCSQFDSGARFECRAEIPARVSPKDRENRCELFEPRLRQEFAQEKTRPGSARSAFDALFDKL